jgi:putative transposase
MRLIDEEFLRHPFYGSKKMTAYLKSKGIYVNRKRIQSLMRLMGLESVDPKPNISRQRKGHKVYPYLLKKMSITEPDPPGSRLCLSDCSNGLGRRYVLSWEVSVTMDDDFCVNALKRVPSENIRHLRYSIQTREHNIQVRLLLVH